MWYFWFPGWYIAWFWWENRLVYIYFSSDYSLTAWKNSGRSTYLSLRCWRVRNCFLLFSSLFLHVSSSFPWVGSANVQHETCMGPFYSLYDKIHAPVYLTKPGRTFANWIISLLEYVYYETHVSCFKMLNNLLFMKFFFRFTTHFF